MRRRALLAGLSAWPAIAQAQGNPEAPKVGFVYPGIRQMAPSRIDALTKGIRAAGYAAPQIEIVTRVTDGDPNKIAPMTAEVLGQKVSVLIATGPVGIHAARALTTTLPIIATNFEEDPVAAGYAQSIAHPGGNISGIFLDFPDFSGKWIELLREFMPQLARIALVWDQRTGRVQVDAIGATAARLNIRVDLLEIKERGDYTGAFVREKDRRTVGRQDSEEQAGAVGDHRIRAWAILLRPGFFDLNDIRRVDLVHGRERCVGKDR